MSKKTLGTSYQETTNLLGVEIWQQGVLIRVGLKLTNYQFGKLAGVNFAWGYYYYVLVYIGDC